MGVKTTLFTWQCCCTAGIGGSPWFNTCVLIKPVGNGGPCFPVGEVTTSDWDGNLQCCCLFGVPIFAWASSVRSLQALLLFMQQLFFTVCLDGFSWPSSLPRRQKNKKENFFFYWPALPTRTRPGEFGVQVNIANPGAQQLVVNFTSEVDRL